MQKAIKIIGWFTLILFVLCIFAAASSIWGGILGITNERYFYVIVHFFRTIGTYILNISFIVLAVLMLVRRLKRNP